MRQLRIGIDASFALGEKNGTSEYTNHLIEELVKLDHKNSYTLFPFFTYIYNHEFKKYQPKLPNNFKLYLSNVPKPIIDALWFRAGFLKRFYLPKFDVFHSTTFVIPPASMYRKLIITIYDASFYTHPQFHLKENVDHCQQGTAEAVRLANTIIAISESTKRDLIEYFDCPAEKIVVTHLAYDQRFNQKAEASQVKKIVSKYALKRPFIFHLGSLEPRKNTLGLIKSFMLLPINLFNKFDLVIGGSRGWLNNEIIEYVHKHRLEDKIRFAGYIPDTDLPTLYQKAKCFVYPSFYEGFGIPPLEAMASGCPVLVSSSSSLPEICGHAALYCHPNDIEEMSTKLKTLLNSDNKILIENGIKQAKKFSWNSTVNKTLNLYNQL